MFVRVHSTTHSNLTFHVLADLGTFSNKISNNVLVHAIRAAVHAKHACTHNL